MSEIFLSYKKEDRAVAERLVEALRASGKSVWWDDALNPHQAWDAMIEREIAASRVVIVLWSPRSVQSDWVRSEAHYAQDHGKLVPVLIEQCVLPMAFMLRQAVDLSSGAFDDGNPQWRKFLGWIDGVGNDDRGEAGHAAAALAAVPLKALTRERWLGPARRPMVAMIAAVAVLAALLGSVLMRGGFPFGKTEQPEVFVDRFAADSKLLPEGFAQSVADEMFTGLSSSSRISPQTSDGRRHADAYQVTGNIGASGDKIQLFAKLFAPGLAAPILTTRLEEPLKFRTAAPHALGVKLAQLTRCVATASDSSGSEITILPEQALVPWAQFCQQSLVGPGEPAAIAGTLRKVVAAAPDFANGWSNLAEALDDSSSTPGADRAGLRAEAAKAADRALALDPVSAKAMVVKANQLVGVGGPHRGPSLLGRMHNFAEWEKLALRSITVRPSDCGCEGPQYAAMLTMFGRQTAAIPVLRQAVSAESSALGHAMFLGNLLARAGQTGEAERILKNLSAQWPSKTVVDRNRFAHALWRKDWRAARTLLSGLADDPEKSAFPALIDALERGDATGARAAGAPFVKFLQNPATMTSTAHDAVALAGYHDEAIASVERGASLYGMRILGLMFVPTMAQARRSPRFAALAAKTGLGEYWSMPGHRPDFCRETPAPAICARLSSS